MSEDLFIIKLDFQFVDLIQGDLLSVSLCQELINQHHHHTTDSLVSIVIQEHSVTPVLTLQPIVGV